MSTVCSAKLVTWWLFRLSIVGRSILRCIPHFVCLKSSGKFETWTREVEWLFTMVNRLKSAPVVELMDHSPYSPDLPPNYFSLIPHIKNKMRSQRFSSPEDTFEAFKIWGCLNRSGKTHTNDGRTLKHSEYCYAKKWQNFQCKCQIASGNTRNMPGLELIDHPCIRFQISPILTIQYVRLQIRTMDFWSVRRRRDLCRIFEWSEVRIFWNTTHEHNTGNCMSANSTRTTTYFAIAN